MRSQSQVSLSVSQKRGDRILKQHQQTLEQLKQTPRLNNEMKVASVEPHGEGVLNLKIEEDEYNQENTMNFGPSRDVAFPRNIGQHGNESDFEEGDADDYNLNEI